MIDAPLEKSPRGRPGNYRPATGDKPLPQKQTRAWCRRRARARLASQWHWASCRPFSGRFSVGAADGWAPRRRRWSQWWWWCSWATRRGQGARPRGSPGSARRRPGETFRGFSGPRSSVQREWGQCWQLSLTVDLTASGGRGRGVRVNKGAADCRFSLNSTTLKKGEAIVYFVS
jgi:hypothetical protein